MPFLNLLKGNKKKKKPGPFKFLERAKKAFNGIKLAFISVLMLIYYNPAIPIMVETNILRYSVLIILT